MPLQYRRVLTSVTGGSPTTDTGTSVNAALAVTRTRTGRMQSRAEESYFGPAIAQKTMILIVVRCTTLFYGVTYVSKNEERESRHALFLFLAKGLIERLPRIGDILQVGCTLGQGIGASLHKIDRIAVAQDLGGTLINLATYRFCYFRDTGLAILCPVTNGIFDSWPVFHLVRCKL
jgi:hypothetical protein